MLFCFVERLKLSITSEYKYLNQSDCLAIHGVDDGKKFQMLVVSLHVVVSVTIFVYILLMSPSMLIVVSSECHLVCLLLFSCFSRKH